MNLSIEDGFLKIDLSRIEKVLSVHGSFRTPLEQVGSVSTGVPRQSWRDLRVPGTFLPWVVEAGRYLTKRGREFWYVTRKGIPHYRAQKRQLQEDRAGSQ